MIEPNQITTRDELIISASARHGSTFTQNYTHYTSGARTARQARRAAILSGNHSELVAAKFAQTFQDADIRRRILPFVNVTLNAGADIATAIACTYKQEITRELEGAEDEAQRAFDQLNFESGLHALAPGVNRTGWFVGPVLEWPRVVNGRFERVFFSPERYEVELDPNDMLGEPKAYAFPWLIGKEQVVVVADESTYSYYKVDGTRIELIRSERHGANAQACTVWRWEKPQDPAKWWVSERHRRIEDGTISTNYAFTILEWVRKNQNRPFWYFFANQEKIIKGQTLDPARPFLHHVKGEDQQPQIGTLDLNAGVSDFVEHIRFTYQALIEGYGIPPSALTFTIGESGLPAVAIEMSTDRMAAIRSEQIPWARAAEWSSAWRALAVAKGMKHPLADKLPGPDFITDAEPGQGLKLDWPELTRSDDPAEKREQMKHLISRGHWSDIDEELKRHPELGDDREAAKKRLIARIKDQKEVDAEKADTPQGGLGADMKTEAERTGEMGPEVRDSLPGKFTLPKTEPPVDSEE